MQIYATLITLIVDALFSWARMFAALGISIALSIVIGVYAATSRRAERVILPIIDILQTIPILAFFPIVIVVFVFYLPGYIGVNAAVIFLIVTSMLWNIIFGVYESIKTIPGEFLEVAQLYRMGIWERLKKIFIPAALPRIVQQSLLSWSIGLFYLVTSEIFSYGYVASNCNYAHLNATNVCSVQHGIGVALIQFSPSATGSYTSYLLGIGVFVVFVVLTRFLFFRPLENYASRYTRTSTKTTTWLARPGTFVSWFSRRVVAQPLTTIGAAVIPKKKAVPQKEVVGGPYVKKRKPAGGWVYYLAAVAVLSVLFAYAAVIRSALVTYEYTVLVSLLFSFARIWLAFAVITAIVLPLCVYLIFVSKQSSKYLLLFQIAASIPATILLPGIAVAFSGLPDSAEIVAFVIFMLSGIWYVIFSVIASTRNMPSSIFEVKELFGVKGTNAWKNIYIKAMLPGFITGALTGIAAEWNASIVAECFTTSGVASGSTISCISGAGIGKLLDGTVASGNFTLMLVALLNLVVMILIINTFLWKRMYKNVSKVYG